MRYFKRSSPLIASALCNHRYQAPHESRSAPPTLCEPKPNININRASAAPSAPINPTQKQCHLLNQMKFIERMQANLTQCPDSNGPILCIECNPPTTCRAPEARRHPRIFCEASWLYETTLDLLLTDIMIPHSSDTMNKIRKLINSEKNTDVNAYIFARALHQILNNHLLCQKENHDRSSNSKAHQVEVLLIELCVDLLSPSHLRRPSCNQTQERLNNIKLLAKNNQLPIKKIAGHDKTIIIDRRDPKQPRLIRTCLKPEGCTTSTDFLEFVYCPMHQGKYEKAAPNKWRFIESVFYNSTDKIQASPCIGDRICLAKSLTLAINTLGKDYVFIDVKLKNFIQTQAGQYYFIDPDSVADNSLTVHNLQTSQLYYDARYAAPEYLDNPATFSKESTVYQLALTWIEAGCIIHPHQDEYQAMLNILHGDQDIAIDLTKQEALLSYLETFIESYRINPDDPTCIAYHRLLQLCRAMLSIRPSSRPTLISIEQQLIDIEKSYDTAASATSMQIPRPGS